MKILYDGSDLSKYLEKIGEGKTTFTNFFGTAIISDAPACSLRTFQTLKKGLDGFPVAIGYLGGNEYRAISLNSASADISVTDETIDAYIMKLVAGMAMQIQSYDKLPEGIDKSLERIDHLMNISKWLKTRIA